MNIVSLKKRQEEVNENFDKLRAQKQDIDSEMVRLQGEYRLLSSLINEAENGTEEEKVLNEEKK